MDKIVTVPDLIKQFEDRGSLLSGLEVYDVTGHQYEIVEIYLGDDNPDIICIDVERVNK